MPLPILPALIAGAAYLIYSGFREEGPVATPKRVPDVPKGAKAKAKSAPKTTPKANVPRETSPKTGTKPKSEAAPKPKPSRSPPAAGTKPKPKPEPKPAPKHRSHEPRSPHRAGAENEKTDDVPRETSP